MKLPRLREWRESRGYSQRVLADRADIGVATVHRIEDGGSAFATTAAKLADALDVQVRDLQLAPPVAMEERNLADFREAREEKKQTEAGERATQTVALADLEEARRAKKSAEVEGIIGKALALVKGSFGLTDEEASVFGQKLANELDPLPDQPMATVEMLPEEGSGVPPVDHDRLDAILEGLRDDGVLSPEQARSVKRALLAG